MQNTVLERMHSLEGDRKRQFFQLGRQCRQPASPESGGCPRGSRAREEWPRGTPRRRDSGLQGSQHHKEPTSLRTAE